MESKKLYLSLSDKKVGGVAGGLAQYFETDSTLVRLLFVLVILVTGIFPGLVTYLIAWLIIPKEPTSLTNTENK